MDGFEEAFDREHERLAGADAHAGGQEVGVEHVLAVSVAEDAGDGDGASIAGDLGLGEELQVLLAEVDFALVHAVGLVAQGALHDLIADVGLAAFEVAVEAVVLAAGHAEVEHERGVGGMEDVHDVAGGRGRIGGGTLEGEAVGEDPGGVKQYGAAVPYGLGVELAVEQAPRFVPQA